MTTFLLELLSEEIPARMQRKAAADLARLFVDELAKAGLNAAVETLVTPRRLALIARDLPLETAAVSEELKGPRAAAPPQALEGFLRKTGLTRDQLTERDGVLFAALGKPGRATAAVIAEAIPAIVRAFPWPKAMRWGEASLSTESLRWVRPLQGIVALLDGAVVPFEIAGIASGSETVGHRFHHPGAIALRGADDYVEQLRAAHVIVDPEERESIIALGATTLAAQAGLTLVRDEGLLAENAGLTEWPVPLLGAFDPAFLDVPPEVIQLTMRTNQKYFACTDGEGNLAPAFVCTANIDATDGGAAIVEGNRKVLAARLSDAKFFWDQDLKVPLEEQAKKLDQIVFHEKLGTVAAKVERVAKLARWLVEEGIVTNKPLPFRGGVGVGDVPLPIFSDTPHPNPSPEEEGLDLATLAERAARLCKADLVTGMVGEFPELQGVMGGYYAAAQGEDPQVAAAIRNHYKPVGQEDDVPTDPVTVAVSLADKLDTLACFWAIGERPTGSKDPFALRRACLSAINLVLENSLSFGMLDLLQAALPIDRNEIAPFNPVLLTNQYVSREVRGIRHFEQAWDVLDFFAERLKVQQREAGIRHDLIDAVFALGGEDDLVRLLARVRALQAFVDTDDGANLLAGYKRAANILKKEGFAPLPAREGPGVGASGASASSLRTDPPPAPPLPGRGDTLEPAETALVAALAVARPAADEAIAREDFTAAMAALAGLRAPIDAFFDQVIVNADDPAVRARRLALLAEVRDAVHRVADFSKIEG